MHEVKENFMGYLQLDGKVYAFNCSGHVIKILPAYESRAEDAETIYDYPKYIYGTSESRHEVAFLQNNKLKQYMFGYGAVFSTPLIIQNTSNTGANYQMFGDWNYFDAITFSGGAINEIYNPKIAAVDFKTIEEITEQSKNKHHAQNIAFDVSLSRKSFDGLFHQTAVCKVYRDYKEYSNRKFHKTIPADKILGSLPTNNKQYISIEDIQNICTALEVAYKQSKHKTQKDVLIASLRKTIENAIKCFAEQHSDFDASKQTKVAYAFKHLDWSAKDKFLYLYNLHEDAMRAVIKHKDLQCDVDENSIGGFINRRNSKAHSGQVMLDENAGLYLPMFTLVYACLFKKIGMSDDDIKKVLLQVA